MDDSRTTPSRIDFNIHNARPEAHRSGSTVWICVPVDDISASVPHNFSLFMDAGAAIRLGQRLMFEGEKAKQILDIDKEPVEVLS